MSLDPITPPTSRTWLEILRHDKRALFTAASKAQPAADWLHSLASVSSPELVSA